MKMQMHQRKECAPKQYRFYWDLKTRNCAMKLTYLGLETEIDRFTITVPGI